MSDVKKLKKQVAEADKQRGKAKAELVKVTSKKVAGAIDSYILSYENWVWANYSLGTEEAFADREKNMVHD